jgi:hypothetical protein
MESGGQYTSNDVSEFMQLVAMFQFAALQQMGKLPNPATNQIERDLPHAKASIDMIEMLKAKTKGNLSGTEEELIDKVLFELHMNYVDEVDRAAKEDKDKAEGSGDASAAESGQEAGEEETGGSGGEIPDDDDSSTG